MTVRAAKTYAEHVAADELPAPRTAFDHLLYGMKPITADDPAPALLQTQIQGGEVVAHRYLPCAPKGTPPEVARAYHAWVDEQVPWVSGPPEFVLRAMASAPSPSPGDPGAKP